MHALTDAFLPDLTPSDLGTISIRAVVLPRKADDGIQADETVPLDLTDDEMLPETGASPVARGSLMP